METKGSICFNQKQWSSDPCPNAYLLALDSRMGVRLLPVPLVELLASGRETCRPSVISACWPKPPCRHCSGQSVYIQVSNLPPYL